LVNINRLDYPILHGRVGAIGEENTNFATGAFYQDGTGGTGHGDGWDYYVFIDASRSNEVYGNADTVQPAAGVVIYLIKY
jgi:hypothetical protein